MRGNDGRVHVAMRLEPNVTELHLSVHVSSLNPANADRSKWMHILAPPLGSVHYCALPFVWGIISLTPLISAMWLRIYISSFQKYVSLNSCSWAGDYPGMDLPLVGCHSGCNMPHTAARILWLVPQRPRLLDTKLINAHCVLYCFGTRAIHKS